jgi:hypothetical protein
MVKRAVAKRLLDEKPSVRKEAVDLLGSFVLSKPGLADSYYDELMARILVRAMALQPVGFILYIYIYIYFMELAVHSLAVCWLTHASGHHTKRSQARDFHHAGPLHQPTHLHSRA